MLLSLAAHAVRPFEMDWGRKAMHFTVNIGTFIFHLQVKKKWVVHLVRAWKITEVPFVFSYLLGNISAIEPRHTLYTLARAYRNKPDNSPMMRTNAVYHIFSADESTRHSSFFFFFFCFSIFVSQCKTINWSLIGDHKALGNVFLKNTERWWEITGISQARAFIAICAQATRQLKAATDCKWPWDDSVEWTLRNLIHPKTDSIAIYDSH